MLNKCVHSICDYDGTCQHCGENAYIDKRDSNYDEIRCDSCDNLLCLGFGDLNCCCEFYCNNFCRDDGIAKKKRERTINYSSQPEFIEYTSLREDSNGEWKTSIKQIKNPKYKPWIK